MKPDYAPQTKTELEIPLSNKVVKEWLQPEQAANTRFIDLTDFSPAPKTPDAIGRSVHHDSESAHVLGDRKRVPTLTRIKADSIASSSQL